MCAILILNINTGKYNFFFGSTYSWQAYFLAPTKTEYIITFKNMDCIYRNKAVKGVDSRFLSFITFILAAVLSNFSFSRRFTFTDFTHSDIVAQWMSIGL